MGQLSPHARTTTELMCLNKRARVPTNYRAYVLWSPRTTTTEPMRPRAHMPQLERENPHATTREKPEDHNEDPTQPKK